MEVRNFVIIISKIKEKNHFLCNSRGPLQKTTTKILSFRARTMETSIVQLPHLKL